MNRYLLLAVSSLLMLAACTRAGGGDVAEGDEPLLSPTGVQLIAHDGRLFRLDEQEGHRAFVFFGYTHCPDACPMMMAKLARVYAQLGAEGREIPAYFISVDPRDTPAALARYVSYFAAIPATGLTGSKEQIDYAVRQFSAYYEIVPGNSAAGPSVNHTTSLYLIDVDGKVRHKFSHADEPDAIVAALRGQS